MNGMLILKSNEIFYLFFCAKSLKSSALSLVFYTSVQNSHISTAQTHVVDGAWLMATMLESAVLKNQKEMPGHEKKKKANLKNAPRVGCNDMQEINMHSFIKQFLQAEDRKKNSKILPSRTSSSSKRARPEWIIITSGGRCSTRDNQKGAERCTILWRRRLENRALMSPSITAG